MKALLLSQYRQLEITDLPRPEPGPGEVLVRVAACGICGSDVHGYDGSSGRRIPPIVMGHEAAGTIAAVGPDVKGVTQGDRVRVTLFPVITGQTGLDPIFQGAADFDLELVENRTLDSHIQELTYRPTLH